MWANLRDPGQLDQGWRILNGTCRTLCPRNFPWFYQAS